MNGLMAGIWVDGKPRTTVERESMYQPEYADELVEWFRDAYAAAIPKRGRKPDGEEEPLNPPTMARFAMEWARPRWGVGRTCLQNWKRTNPEFGAACQAAEEMYEVWLDRIASSGIGGASWHALAAANRLGWAARQDLTSAGQRLPASGAVAIAGVGGGSGEVAQTLADALRRVGLMAGPPSAAAALPGPAGSPETRDTCDTNAVSGSDSAGFPEGGPSCASGEPQNPSENPD